MPRVVIAEDDLLVREGVASLLEKAGYEVVGKAADAPEFLTLVAAHRPELVIVDIRMPPDHGTEGLEAARTVRRDFPEIAILVLSAHVEAEQAMELLAGGRGSGYLLKSRVANVIEFVQTVGRIVDGGSMVDPALVKELIAARRRHDPLAPLTEREREVLLLMTGGRSNAEIAGELFLSEATVKTHVTRILAKLQLRDRVQIVVFAYEHRLLGDAP